MKTIKTLGLLVLLLGSSCQKDSEPQLCASCENRTFVGDFSNVSGIVKKVADENYFYDGRNYYIELSSQAIPGLQASGEENTLRLFACASDRFTAADEGREVSISGKAFLCTTDKHGKITNNFYTFNIFD